MYRKFKNQEEENKASKLIESIDSGEAYIFNCKEEDDYFEYFIDRLFYESKDNYGVFVSCVCNGRLRIQIAFKNDMPDEIKHITLELIEKARKKVNTYTSIWYIPSNVVLNDFLQHELPWKGESIKTHELMFDYTDYNKKDNLNQDIFVTPFNEKYLDETCAMLDKSLAHTFDDPIAKPFSNNKLKNQKKWMEKSKNIDCMIALNKDEVVGAYILKQAEIDYMAVKVSKQDNGIGRILLDHAARYIIKNYKKNPYLYCIERNPKALKFYLREGMYINAYSAGLLLEELS